MSLKLKAKIKIRKYCHSIDKKRMVIKRDVDMCARVRVCVCKMRAWVIACVF